MKKFRIYCDLSYLLSFVVILLSACSSDNETLPVDESSLSLLKSEITLPATGGSTQVSIALTEGIDGMPSLEIDQSDADWLSGRVEQHAGKLTIFFEAQRNSESDSRQGHVTLRIGKAKADIRVRQAAMSLISDVKQSAVHVPNTGAMVDFNFRCNGHYQCRILRKTVNLGESDGAEIVSQTQQDDNCRVRVQVNQNDFLGRVICLEVSTSDTLVYLPIIQEPRQLHEAEDIVLMGTPLPILLDDDDKNLNHLRKLTLSGAMGANDFYELQKIITTHEDAGLPLSLDLYWASIKKKVTNIYDDWGSVLPKITDNVEDDILPSGYFSNADCLKEVVLPATLQTIDAYALANCTGLKHISIPNDVATIGNRAFAGCKNLTQIDFTERSLLRQIGSEAFATGSVLESLRLGVLVEKVAANAFAGCQCRSLYVAWDEPLQGLQLPFASGCKLYVPQGSRASYLSTSPWNSFAEILEYEPDK
jgi:hypothetical protein